MTLNGPESRNGWSPHLEATYFAVLERCNADDDVRAVVVTGAGRSFCPGAAAGQLGDVATGGLDLRGRFPQYRPRAMSKPMIAAINGACAGIGLVQALICDVRFAARRARCSTAFAHRGLAEEYAISWVLPRYVGVEAALDLLLSARTFDAEEAYRLGLVSRIVDDEQVVAAATAYERDLATNCAPSAMAAMRRQVYTDLDSSDEPALRRSLLLAEAAVASPNFAEGTHSFVERRDPSFAALSRGLDAADVISMPVPGVAVAADDVLVHGSD